MGIDFELVFPVGNDDFAFIDGAAVVPFRFHPQVVLGCAGNFRQHGLDSLFFREGRAGRGGPGQIVDLRVDRHDLPRSFLDFIVVIFIRGVEIHLIQFHPVVPLFGAADGDEISFRHPGVLQGDGFRFIGGDGIACLDALNRRAGCVGGLCGFGALRGFSGLCAFGGLSGFLRGLLGLCDFLRLGGGLSVRCGAGRQDGCREGECQ